MLIECPFCHTRAKLPESKEGAKVRCSECSKVYRARELLASGPRKSSSGPIIAVIAVGAVAFGLLLYLRGGDDAPPPVEAAAPKPAPKPAPVAEVDPNGWDSEPVQLAVALHGEAAAGDAEALRDRLYGPLLDDGAQRSAEADEAWRARVPTAAATDAWEGLADDEREARIERAIASLTDLGEAGTVAAWSPYDGEVVEETDDHAVVRLSATPIGSSTKRVVEWRLARDGDQWKAYSWEQWLSDAERRRRSRGYEIVKLSDGSVVVEREPEPLGHLEDTPEELRQRIDELLATMIDLDLTTQAAEASREMIEIGKPAIPILLTHLYENKLYTPEDSIRANIVVQALRAITDQYFGYQPQALVGSAMGTTEERRMSAIRQWFAWWYRKGDDFTGLPEVEDEE